MTSHRIASVEPLHYPALRVTFVDGIAGILDFSDSITTGAIFAPLEDEAFSRTVAVGDHGRTFGWKLDAVGREIGFCPDTARIRIETQIVEVLASRYESAHAAAA